MHSAEIIAIGTELTSGAKLDTNSQWLSLQLADLGIPVIWHTTVADDLIPNRDAVLLAASRVDLILISGGLGPTLDDLTRHALATAAGTELVLNQEALEDLEAFFKSRGRPMPERNRIQAMFPAGSEMLPNPIGTAPGIWMTLVRPDGTQCAVAALPGVPSELYRMFLEQVRPRLPGGKKLIRRARINCFGIGESHTEELLGELTARGRDPEIGITAHEATITLRIISHGSSESECLQKINAVSQEIRARLGDHVFGVEDEELEDIVLSLLAERNLQLHTVENATDGQLAWRLAEAQRRLEKSRSGNQDQAGRQLPFLLGEIRPDLGDSNVQFDGESSSLVHLRILDEQRVAAAGGREASQVKIQLLIPGREFRQVQLMWNGNPAIFRSKTCKSALDLLRRSLLEMDLSLYVS